MTSQPLRVLLVGGGSTGHLAPLVAVWRAFALREPGATVCVLCTDRAGDASFVAQEGLRAVLVPYPWRSWSLPLTLLRIARTSWRVLQSEQPHVVLSKGGVVSLPVCCLAWLRRIPVVVHESDAVMGWGTWVVSWFARYICLGTPPAAGSTLAPRVVLTGNPVRPAILQGSRERGLQLTGLSGLRPILFVTGGSQGAEALNRAIIAQLPALLAVCDVVHLTGRGKQSATAHAGYWSAETSGESMGDLYACASLALIRGGAGSLTECARLRLPAMVVPLQGLAQDHQVRNAERAAAQGGVIHLPEVQLDQLTACVRDLLKNAARLQQMKTALEKASFPLAAETIASLLSSLVLPDQKNG